jgi:hypothetical protein
LAALGQDAKKEKEAVFVQPSEETAFLLLRGLASQGTEMELSEKERIRGGSSARLFAFGEDVRVEFYSQSIQDRAGTWTLHQAYLARKKDGKWIACGSGRWAGESKTFPMSTVREIQPEEARQAIIELIERSSDNALKSSLPLVKNAKITPSAVGGKWLDIGPWACFLAERRVSMMVGTPASYHSFQGDLELSSNGKWRVTNLRGGYVCALPLPPAPPPMVPPAK